MKNKLLFLSVIFTLAGNSRAQMSPNTTKDPLTLNQTVGKNTGPKTQRWEPIRTNFPKGNGPYQSLKTYISKPNFPTDFKLITENPIKMGKLEVTQYSFYATGFAIDKYLNLWGGGWRIPTWAEMEIIAANATFHPNLAANVAYRTLQYSMLNESHVKFRQRCCHNTAGFVMIDGPSITVETDTDDYFYEYLMATVLVRDAK